VSKYKRAALCKGIDGKKLLEFSPAHFREVTQFRVVLDEIAPIPV
jgi:hypothetical protein